MECKITVSVVQESLEGDIGDDWEYSITATILDPSGARKATARIPVKKHTLKPGTSQPPPQAVGVKIPAGRCGTHPHVELKVDVSEVDWLVNDPGTKTIVVPVECPGSGKPPFTKDAVIAIQVRERPAILRGEATFTLRLRLVAACV